MKLKNGERGHGGRGNREIVGREGGKVRGAQGQTVPVNKVTRKNNQFVLKCMV